MDIPELIIGALIGAIIGLFSTYWFFYSQFSKGNGGHRMRTVADATREFNKRDLNTGIIRNKYRYGLGVIIDELELLNREGFKLDGTIPTLIDQGADHWNRFNLYVRPVVDDINAYTLLRTLPNRLFPRIRQLAKLVDLCNQLEIVVMHLDAASAENPKIIGWDPDPNSNGHNLVLKSELTNPRVTVLTDELKKLSDCWQAWKNAIGIKERQR